MNRNSASASGWRVRTAALGAALVMSGAVFGDDARDRERSGRSDPQVRALPLKQRLGRALFLDTSLSNPPGQSCATCHDPRAAFTDPDGGIPTSQGVILGLFGSRNSPTAMYAAFSPAFHFNRDDDVYVGGQFLDGRVPSLEDQARGPFLNPIEMANPDKQSVIDKIRAGANASLFELVYGPDSLRNVDAAYDNLVDAIAEFERSPIFSPFTSKFDAVVAGNARFTPQEARGLRVFVDPAKGNCAACHPSAPSPQGAPALFTDFTYDNLGVPRNPANPFYRMPPRFNPDGSNFVDKGLGTALGLASQDGKFKVPTLRNIAITAPYMHNGYFSSLRAVVDFYNTRDVKPACRDRFTPEREALRKGCWPAAEVTDNVNRDELGNLRLGEREVDDLVAFLQTLTDGWTSDRH